MLAFMIGAAIGWYIGPVVIIGAVLAGIYSFCTWMWTVHPIIVCLLVLAVLIRGFFEICRGMEDGTADGKH